MYLLHIFYTLSFIVSISIASVCKGCVSLDEFNFYKIVPKFEAVLAKFDVNYPIGKKHDIFSDLASEIVDNKNIIFALVPIRDYGKDNNEKFGKSHGIHSEDDLPTLKLFVKGVDKPFVFGKNATWNDENMKEFVLNHTNIYWGVPGRLETFDKIAVKFTFSNDKAAVFRAAKLEANKLKNERHKKIANTYINIMKDILDNGFEFAFEQQHKLEKEAEDLSHRLNILKLFTTKPETI